MVFIVDNTSGNTIFSGQRDMEGDSIFFSGQRTLEMGNIIYSRQWKQFFQ